VGIGIVIGVLTSVGAAWGCSPDGIGVGVRVAGERGGGGGGISSGAVGVRGVSVGGGGGVGGITAGGDGEESGCGSPLPMAPCPPNRQQNETSQWEAQLLAATSTVAIWPPVPIHCTAERQSPLLSSSSWRILKRLSSTFFSRVP